MSDFAVVKALLSSLYEYCRGPGTLQRQDVETIVDYVRQAISCKGMCTSVQHHLIEAVVLLSKFHAALMNKTELATQLQNVLKNFKGDTVVTVRVTAAATSKSNLQVAMVKLLSLNVALHSQLLAAENKVIGDHEPASNTHSCTLEVGPVTSIENEDIVLYSRDDLIKLKTYSSFSVPDFPNWAWKEGVAILGIDTPPNTPTTITAAAPIDWKRW